MNPGRAAFWLATLMLCACAASPLTRFYTLTPANESALVDVAADRCARVTLALGPISLPEHLARSQLVSRRPDADMQLQINEFVRWGAPLPREFQHAFTDAVGRHLRVAALVAYPLQDRFDTDWRIGVDVQRFDGVAGGPVHLLAQWTIWRAGKIHELTRRTSLVAASLPSEADYVATLRALLEKMVEDIANAFAPLCSTAPALDTGAP